MLLYPAEKDVKPANEQVINIAYQIFSENLRDVEYLIGYEGNAFAFTGDVEEDLLSITAVHPMREEGVNEFLSKAKSDWSVIEKLIEKGELIETTYQGNKFYIRSFSNKQ
jgi:wyosine [tRNA(Phe)-imidazoG37] synthetase (radical SAM superfamily)